MSVKIIGSYVSPYVRKVLATVVLKGLEYEIDPITAFYGNEEFERLSPLRQIPVLIDGDVELCDSTVICEYLDEAYPEKPVLPRAIKDRARARWFDEYADSRLGDIFIWGFFYQKIVYPAIWGKPGDAARVEQTLQKDAPAACTYLEHHLPQSGFMFGEEISLADISVASFFRNAAYAGFEPDPARWPRLSRYLHKAFDHACFAALLPFEDAQRSTDMAGRRLALQAAGAPLTSTTLGTAEAQKSLMR